MHWVYILKCLDGIYYCGETKRLYRRFWEHENGNTINTSIYTPVNIVAIYKVDTICKFIRYNNSINEILNGKYVYEWELKYNKQNILTQLKNWNKINSDIQGNQHTLAENNITECLMIHKKKEWNKIRGGKYVRFDIIYNFPNNKCIKDLPLCYCGLPCDIKKNDENNYLFFRCAKKNMWKNFKEIFEIKEEPCKFYMEYIKDKNIKLESYQLNKNRKEKIKELFLKSYWLENIEIYDGKKGCINCSENRSEKLLVKHNNKLRLCLNCFINDNDELSEEYSLFDKCLIKLDKI